jgi:hypothetical protein
MADWYAAGDQDGRVGQAQGSPWTIDWRRDIFPRPHLLHKIKYLKVSDRFATGRP